MENMEQETENTAPVPPVPQTPEPKKDGGIGPVLGIAIIIILLALGGVYYFTTGVNNIPSYEAETDTTVKALDEQSSSDAIADIEADLEATDLSEIDLLLEDIEADLQNI